MKKKIISVLLIFGITFAPIGLISNRAIAYGDSMENSSTDVVLTNENSSNLANGTPLYGKTKLSQRNDSAKYLMLYNLLEKGVKKFQKSINGLATGLLGDEFVFGYKTFVNDNPKYFWVQNGASYKVNSATKKLYTFEPNYYKFGNLSEAKEKYEAKIEEILSTVDQSWDEERKVKYIHDYICNNVKYNLDAKNANNAYGALVEGEAVCEGYSRAMQDLLQRLGIECFCVSGTAQKESEKKPVEHLWNLVKVNGKYYHLDTTWDDVGTFIYYGYFLIPTDTILKNHTIANDQVSIPNCTDNIGIYYTTGKTLDEILEYAEKNSETERIISGVQNTEIKLSTTAYKKAMNLKISKSKGFAVESYQIYMSKTGKTGTYKKIKTTKNLSYKNTGLISGKRYYYKVRGIREVGEETVYTKWSNVSYRKAK